MPGVMTNSTGNRLMNERVPAGGGPWRLLSLMIFVFLVFLISWLGLAFGYSNFLKARIDSKKADLQKLAEEIPKEQQDAYLQFQYQLINLKKLLDGHITPAQFFPIFEANTNQSVSITSFDLSASDNKIILQGAAHTLQAIGQQLEAYEKMPQVVRYELQNTKVLEGGKIDFTAVLYLDPKILKLPTTSS